MSASGLVDWSAHAMTPNVRARFLAGLFALATVAAAPTRPPAPAPTRIPTPVPPERAPGSLKKGAAAERREGRYENPRVSFSKITRVEEVDLDGDGAAEALVEGIGTFRSLPPEIPAIGFVTRRRLPFENPIFAVFKRIKGNQWDLLLAGHLPLRCRQNDDPARCDELYAFTSVPFRFDDRRQVAVQVLHAGEPRVSETRTYRLEGGRLLETFGIALPKSAVEVSFSPDGVTRDIAVDTFINKDLPPRYRSFTLGSNYVFGERKFRILSESLAPEWGGGDVDLAYWGLVHQPTFAGDVARLQERQRRAATEAPWTLDPVELVKKRFPDARDVRLAGKQPGLAIVYFERVGCPAHVVVFQPLREWEGEKSLWDFAVIRSPEEPAYECLGEAPLHGQ